MNRKVFIILLICTLINKIGALDLTPEEENWLNNNSEIRIGIMNNWAPMDYIDTSGNPRGIGVDFIHLLNKKLRNKIKIVPGTWTEIYNDCKDGKLDAVMDITPRKEREEYFYFTENYVEVPHIIVSLKNETYFDKIEDLKGLDIAVEKGYFIVNYLNQNHPDIKVREFSSTSDALDAVSKGLSTAYIGNRAVATYIIERELIGNLSLQGKVTATSSQNSIGISKKYPILASILTKALKSISDIEKHNIYKRWGSISKETIFLSQKEIKWISDHPVVTVAFDANYAPYSYEFKSGVFKGIAVDFVEEISGITGISFKHHKEGTWKKLYQNALEHKVDVIATLVKTSERDKSFNFTKPYISLAQYIITSKSYDKIINRDDIQGKKVALVRSYSTSEKIVTEFPAVIPVYVDSLPQALQSVSSGKADLTVAAMGTAQHIIAGMGIQNLKFSSVFAQGISDQRFGTRKDWPELNTILDKALASITEEKRIEIFTRWSRIEVAEAESVKPLKHEVELTMEEIDWIETHPVIRVSNEYDYAPFDFNKNKEPLGYSIDYVKMLLEKVGLKVVWETDNWSSLLDKSQKKEVDLIHSIFNTPDEREEYLNFTKPYKKIVNGIVVPLGEDHIKSLDDIAGKRLAVVKGDSLGIQLESLYPVTQFIKYDTYSQAMKAVAFGSADLTICELPVAIYLIRDYSLNNLYISGEIESIGKRDQQLRLAVRKDWPILINILEKTMDTIPMSELNKLNDKWLTTSDTDSSVDIKDREISLFQLPTAIRLILIFLIFFTIIIFIIRFLNKRSLIYNMSAVKSRKFIIALNGLLLIIVISLAWWGLDIIKYKVLASVNDTLTTVLTTTKENLLIWNKDQKHILHQIGSDRKLISLVEELTHIYNNKEDYKNNDIQKKIRAFFNDRKDQLGDIGYFIISPDGISLSSKRDANIGSENLIYKQEKELFKRILNGESIMIPPIISDVPIAGSENVAGTELPPTMFYTKPVTNSNGEVIAVLTNRYNPSDDFSNINKLGRLGKTGETYVFNRSSKLLSSSRFHSILKSHNILGPEEQSILSIEIRDPGGNMLKGYKPVVPKSKMPYTFMFKNCITGTTHSTVESYRDYRGVPVLGAWTWIDELGIGMATEIDYDEALNTYNTVKWVVWIILIIIIIISLTFTIILFLLGESANKSLKIHNYELENIIKQRTSELIEAKDEAENANKTKSMFLANMSHEIRTPMNAVIGLTHLMTKTKLTEKQQDYMLKIDRSAKSLLGIINDILDFSKIEAGKMSIENTDFSLKEVLNNIRDILNIKIKEKGIDLSISVDQDVPDFLNGDPLRISQILLNLTNNAEKFTEHGSIKIKCEQTPLKKNYILLKFSVIDTGIGLSETQKSNLFKSFHQGDITTTRKYGGTGLGLTISKKLAQLMDGDIEVKSKEGKGSTFSFTVKCKSVKRIKESEENKSTDIPAEINSYILLVEDNEINQQVALEILNSRGLRVDIANNGLEAVSMVNRNKYDLILMDLQMPEMDGIETTHIIRLSQNDKSLPIIAMTADAMEGVKESVLKSGMNDYISKPIDNEQLFKVIGKWVKKGAVVKQPEANNDTESLGQVIKHIDYDLALRRLNNNKDLYFKLLKKFMMSNSEIGKELIKLYKKGKTSECLKILHRLRGVSGNISATTLFNICVNLETELNKDFFDINIVEDLLEEFKNELICVINEIKNYI